MFGVAKRSVRQIRLREMKNTEAKNKEELTEEKALSVGETLRAAREAKGLSVEQLVRDLRIDARFLLALEQDEFEVFSAPVFTKGYMRQYSQRVGLEYEDILKKYTHQVGSRDVPMMASQPIQLDSGRRLGRWMALMLFVALLSAGFGAWYFYFDSPSFMEVITSTEGDFDSEVDRFAAIEPLIIELNQTDESLPNEMVDSVPASSAPTSVSLPLVEQSLVLNVGQFKSESYVEADNEEDPHSLPLGLSKFIEIAFDQDCWTEITDINGEHFYYDLGRAGSRSFFDAHLPLSFLLGNVNGVQIRVDGEPYMIPADSHNGGNVAHFVIAEDI